MRAVRRKLAAIDAAIRLTAVMAIFGVMLLPLPTAARDSAGIGAPCTTGAEGEACGPTAGGANATCRRQGESLLCLYAPCSSGNCPSGQTCSDLTAGGAPYQACIPAGSTTVGSGSSRPPTSPRLQVPIPTVSFSSLSDVDGNAVGIPWIADYISGTYKYAVGAGAVVAATMMMLGGFQYLTAGGDSGRVGAAKEKMKNAVVGLLLLVGGVLVLDTFSAGLTQLKNVRVTTVTRKAFTLVSNDQIRAVTGSDPVARGQMLQMAQEAAERLGGRNFACFVYGSMVHESGGRMNALGHDENATSTQFSVSARRTFQNSGVKHSGATFPAVGCSDRTCQNRGPLNDDSFDLTNPPEYGLDWRFSHGFGSGQSTIFRNSQPCPGKETLGRGFRMGSNCYTIQDLMDPAKQVEAMVNHYHRCWRNGGSGSNVARSYVCYAGTIAEDNPIIQARIDVYNRCVGSGG